jgi:hypothetical protein
LSGVHGSAVLDLEVALVLVCHGCSPSVVAVVITKLLRWGGRAVATVAERATLSTDLPCQLVPPGP